MYYSIYIIWRQKKLNILRHGGSFIMMKTPNMGIVYVAPVQNKAGKHFMVNLSDHEVQCHNKKNSY